MSKGINRKMPQSITKVTEEVVGKCPECGRDVYVGKTSYYCQNYYLKTKNLKEYIRNHCFFRFTRDRLKAAGKDDITPNEMRALLQGDLIKLEGIRRKDGETFNTYGALKFKPKYRWSIDFVSISAMACK